MGRDPYLFHRGRFYRPWRGGYISVFPPVGLVISVLPPGFKVVMVSGVTYYLCEGVYYQTAPGGYVVVSPPAVAQTVSPAHLGVVPPSQSASGTVVVNVPALNVRSGPGMAYPVLLVLKQTDQLIITGRTGDWLLISTPSGALGWVAQQFTIPGTPPASG
jgi:hypothetical protein